MKTAAALPAALDRAEWRTALLAKDNQVVQAEDELSDNKSDESRRPGWWRVCCAPLTSSCCP